MPRRCLAASPSLLLPLAAVAAIAGCTGSAAAPAASPASPAAAAPAGASLCTAAIARVWHGRTPVARTDEYSAYISAAITKFRDIPGNRGYQLLRETVGDETHFTVISYWTSRDAIRAYAGEDIRKTRHLPRDAELLIDPEQTVKNYDLVVQSLDCPGAAR
jgi:heme-degrading monooxygenase HmoA